MRFLYEVLRKQILPLEEIDKNVPVNGVVVDLGCGQGIISSYLAKKKTRKILGLDANLKRLPKNFEENLNFKNFDITKANLIKADCFILSDVLHHLSKDDQKRILQKASNSLNKKGRLIIKEIDAKERFRSKLSRLWDFILYPKDKITFLNSQELKKNLEKIGLKVKITRPCRLFPGSTTLFVCQK